jgi:hypothetical protein
LLLPILGELFGALRKGLVRGTDRFLSILGKIIRRVDDVENDDGNGNRHCVQDVVRPFVTCEEERVGQGPNSEGWTGRRTPEIARGRPCVEVDRDEFCSDRNEGKRVSRGQAHGRTSEAVDGANHNERARDVERVHEPAKVGDAGAEVARGLEIEPDGDEEEDGEGEDLDEQAGLEDAPRALQLVEGERVVEEHRGADALRDDRDAVCGDEDGGDPVGADQREAAAAVHQARGRRARPSIGFINAG